MDLVSIVIPTYNRAKYLREAVESAQNQTYPNTEILVIDDGSTDNTKEIISDYNVKYFYKPNGGPASALNLGIKNMNGEWFKWLSSDDVLLPNTVEELLNFARGKQALFVYGGYQLIDQDWNPKGVKRIRCYETLEELSKVLYEGFVGNGSTSLIHKSVFDRVGLFDESLRFGEDLDLWMRIVILHKIMMYGLDKPIAYYRLHNEQLTEQVSKEISINNRKIRDKFSSH